MQAWLPDLASTDVLAPPSQETSRGSVPPDLVACRTPSLGVHLHTSRKVQGSRTMDRLLSKATRLRVTTT